MRRKTLRVSNWYELGTGFFDNKSNELTSCSPVLIFARYTVFSIFTVDYSILILMIKGKGWITNDYILQLNQMRSVYFLFVIFPFWECRINLSKIYYLIS